MAICPIYKSEPIIVHFLATVAVPVGYKVEPSVYKLHLTTDHSEVLIDTTTELKESTIILDATATPPITLNCVSKVYNFAIHGPLFYNLVIERFRTASTSLNASITAFSTSNTVPIQGPLGFACYECNLPSDAFQSYTFDIEQGTEFVVTDIGAIIPHNETDPSDFFAALSDPNTSQIIQVPYTITITSVDPTPTP